MCLLLLSCLLLSLMLLSCLMLLLCLLCLFLFLTFDFMLILVTYFLQMVVQLCLKLLLACVASTVPWWLQFFFILLKSSTTSIASLISNMVVNNTIVILVSNATSWKSASQALVNVIFSQPFISIGFITFTSVHVDVTNHKFWVWSCSFLKSTWGFAHVSICDLMMFVIQPLKTI